MVLSRLGFGALVAWVAKTAGISTLRSTALGGLAIRRVLAQAGDPDAFIEATPETQPYRDKAAIGRLFDSLSMRIEGWWASSSCYVVRVGRQEGSPPPVTGNRPAGCDTGRTRPG